MNNFDITSFDPVVINNFFTEEYLNQIVKVFQDKIDDNIKNGKEKYYDFNKNEKMGMFVLEIPPITNGDLFQYMYEKIEKMLGTKIKITSSLKYHRYTSETGTPYPNVKPHVDIIYNQHLIAFSLPINNTNKKIWPMYVDRTKYSLEDNTALFFNATNTLHWRPSRRFLEEDFYDVLVFRFFEEDNVVPMSVELSEKLEQKRKDIMENYYY